MYTNLRAIVEDRSNVLRKVNELQTPVWEAILGEMDQDKTFAGRATTLGRRMHTALEDLRTGKVSRVKAIQAYQRALQELRVDYEGRSIEALWRNAKLHPSAAEMIIAWYGKSVHDLKLHLETDRYLGWLLQRPPLRAPSDVGSVQQGLGGEPAPPPLNSCAMSPYAFHDDRSWSQVFAPSNSAMSSPSSGSVSVDVSGDLDGGASAHSLVGADFSIPAGFTTISVTADVDWSYSGWTFVIGGVAGTGADLTIRIENPAGTMAPDSNESLFSLLSPVVWGNSATGSGESLVTGSIATPDAKARTIRVFAGITAHAEAVSGFAAGCQTTASAFVRKICVSAT